MLRHPGLVLRMILAGTILFAFYLLVAMAMIIGGIPLEFVLLITLGFVGFQYKFGKWAAIRSIGAEDADPADYPHLTQAIESLSRNMNLPEPRLMVADMGVPNAFAVGRKGNGTVVVSRELMNTLDRQELEGVLAHELAHIRNRDVVMMVMGQSIASLVGIVVTYAMIIGRRNIGAYFLGYIAGIMAQMLVMIFVLALSRYREYVADADAAEAIGTGDPLARALEKIQQGNEHATESAIDDNVSALCIFDSDHGLLRSIFSTHPPTEKRIRRLREGYY